MANKNHALDGPILDSARDEFLAQGFEQASLRKIAAAAGVTVGAIHTRWPTKDLLFRALVQPLLERITAAFGEIRAEYSTVTCPGDLPEAMTRESDRILHLLFDNRDPARLLLCRSGGSSLEHVFDRVVEEKIRETEVFFAGRPGGGPDPRVLRLLIGSQFHLYQQIMAQDWTLQEARAVLTGVMCFEAGGWNTLLGVNRGKEGADDEV